MGMGNAAAEGTPKPLDAVGVRVIRRRVHQYELTAQFIEEAPQQERAFGRVDTQVVKQHYRDPPARLRTLDGATQLGAERGGLSAKRSLPIQPTVAPVNQAEAVLLDVVARRLDQPLAAASLPTPDAGEGGMQRNLNFILQVQVGTWQQTQQPGQVLWEVVPQQRVRQQIFNGWRLGQCRSR